MPVPVPASASSVPPRSMTRGDGVRHLLLPVARLEAGERSRERTRVREHTCDVGADVLRPSRRIQFTLLLPFWLNRERSLVAGLFVLVASLRFLSLTGFPDDHYVHLAGAQQMLHGEWPSRDFVDLGAPLTYAISAAAQAVFGQRQLTEALLMATAFGLGAVLTLRAGVMLTGSIVLGLAAALIEVLVYPRTYSYPKIVLVCGGGGGLALVREEAVSCFASWLWPDSRRLPHWSATITAFTLALPSCRRGGVVARFRRSLETRPIRGDAGRRSRRLHAAVSDLPAGRGRHRRAHSARHDFHGARSAPATADDRRPPGV